MPRPKVLILGKLPPPYMGPAIATGIILGSKLKDSFELLHLNTKINDKISSMGKLDLGKVKRNIGIYSGLRKMIRRNRPDLVLIPISQTTMGFLKDAPFIYIASRGKQKVLLQLRGSNFLNWYNSSSFLTKWFIRRSLKRADGIIVLGDNLRYLFADFYPPEKIYVVPNGANYNIPECPPNPKLKALYLANLIPSKGIEDILMSLTVLSSENSEALELNAFGAWGSPEFKSHCESLAQKSKTEITFNTSVSGEDKFRQYAEADLFIFTPREPEGHPWVIVEAMAAGLPIISTDQGAIRESVEDGVNGFIVPHNNPQAIAEKVELLIQDEELRNKMGRNSREIYLRKFTEERMVENLRNTFEDVLKDDKSLEQVEEFWDENLCGHHFVQDEYLSPEFFKKYREFRYKKTHHLNTYIDWEGAKGKDVLEIGLGIGSDGTRWAAQARSYTGVDLTNEAVEATKIHLGLHKLTGTVEQGNAESLQFKDGSFNLVYSHGVIHHTPDIDRALSEINRVLKPDGEVILMLYAKGSFNYWVRIQGYFRIRMLASILVRKLGGKLSKTWEEHYQNWKKKGWKYLGWKEWPHHCTDGPNCEIANIYTQKEIRQMLEKQNLKVTRMKKAHFPVRLSPATEQFLGRFLGFHQLVWASKKGH